MYDRKHVLLTFGGTLPGQEEWSCGIRLAGKNAGPLDSDDFNITDEGLNDLMGSYHPAVESFIQDDATGIYATCQLKWIKAAYIGHDGKYVTGQQSVVEREVSDVQGGRQGSYVHPNQICTVVSTVTEQTRGLAKRGRFYLPLPGYQIQADGAISQMDANNLATRAAEFLVAISDVPGVDLLYSPGAAVMSKVGAGKTNHIIGVEVGRALDTQRRRRRSLLERWTFADVDQGAA